MKKAVILISLLIISLFPVSSVSSAPQTHELKTEDVIIVLPGENVSGTISALNPTNVSFTAVVYTGYSVEGLPPGSINFSPGYGIFKDWKAGEVQKVPFNVSVSPDVAPGVYPLLLKFRGMAEEGSIHTLILEVPLRVTTNPVVLKSVDLRVLERPDFKGVNPFNGETLLILVHLKNVGVHPVGARVSLEVGGVGTNGTLYENSSNVIVPPEGAEVEFRVPIGWDWDPSKYNLSLSVSTLQGSEGFWRVIEVSTGIGYLNVSLSHESVMLGDDLKGYVMVLSERRIALNLSVSAVKDGSVVWGYSAPISLTPGTKVLELDLPTNVSGRITLTVGLSYGGRIIANSSVQYRVLDYPSFGAISVHPDGDELRVNLSLVNPNPVPLGARLYYNLSAGGTLLYSDSESLLLEPGESRKGLEFKVPRNVSVDYTFVLLEDGRKFDEGSGSVFVPPVSPTRSTTPPSNVSSTSNRGGGGRNDSLILAVGLALLVIVVLAGLFLGSRGEEGYVSPWERARKPRTRPKPKRRSPLGRFKRPKLPKFIENRELPRRFKHKKASKPRKKR